MREVKRKYSIMLNCSRVKHNDINCGVFLLHRTEGSSKRYRPEIRLLNAMDNGPEKLAFEWRRVMANVFTNTALHRPLHARGLV
jgi:hypothetical protein